jgi:hypothetical protein
MEDAQNMNSGCCVVREAPMVSSLEASCKLLRQRDDAIRQYANGDATASLLGVLRPVRCPMSRAGGSTALAVELPLNMWSIWRS